MSQPTITANVTEEQKRNFRIMAAGREISVRELGGAAITFYLVKHAYEIDVLLLPRQRKGKK